MKRFSRADSGNKLRVYGLERLSQDCISRYMAKRMTNFMSLAYAWWLILARLTCVSHAWCLIFVMFIYS